MNTKTIGSNLQGKEPQGKILKATHEAPVEIAPGIFVTCSVLEDGRSVVMQKDLLAAIGRKQKKVVTKEGILALPDNLKPFVSNSLLKCPRIKFVPVSKMGARAYGFEAQVIVDLCRVYARAYTAGVLHHKQEETGRIARAIMDALAGVGLEALIHEATGYRDQLEKDAYRRMYERFLSPELVPWTKTFPDEFFFNICRLKHWNYNSRSEPKWPQYMGKLIMKLVYSALPDEVVEDLKRRTPRVDGSLQNRLFQYLSPDLGARLLIDRIKLVNYCLRISDSWEAFEYHLSRMDPHSEWQPMLFEDVFATELDSK